MAHWNLDPAHTSVEFSVKHMMVSTVRGSFSNASGTISFDPANLAAAAVTASVPVTTISTGVADRDAHLQSADFFNAEINPTIDFESTSVEVKNDTVAKVHGNLSMNGITRAVTFDVEFLGQINSPFGDVRAGFEASTRINREDWNLTWNQALEAGGVLVSKDVNLSLGVQAVLAS